MVFFSKAWIHSCLRAFPVPAPTCCFHIPIAFYFQLSLPTSFVFASIATHNGCHMPTICNVLSRASRKGEQLPPLDALLLATAVSTVSCWPQKVTKASQLFKQEIMEPFPRGLAAGLPETHRHEIAVLILCVSQNQFIWMSVSTDISTFRQGKLQAASPVFAQ